MALRVALAAAALLFLLLTATVSAHFHFNFCSAGSPIPPPLAATDEVEVWFMEAPLFEMAFGKLLGKGDLYHNAIGLKNRNTGEMWTIEYDAEHEVWNATFPQVVTDGNKTDLLWLDAGGICVYNWINETFWMHNRTLMAVTNGTIINDMFAWLPEDNATYPLYETFYVWDKWRGTKFFEPSTCAEFVWRYLRRLLALGVPLNLYQHPRHDFINLYSAEPTPVDPSDPLVWQQIITWYSYFQFHDRSPEEIWRQLRDADHSPSKFLHAYGRYYALHLVEPWLNFCYAEDPLDGSAPPLHPDRCYL